MSDFNLKIKDPSLLTFDDLLSKTYYPKYEHMLQISEKLFSVTDENDVTEFTRTVINLIQDHNLVYYISSLIGIFQIQHPHHPKISISLQNSLQNAFPECLHSIDLI